MFDRERDFDEFKPEPVEREQESELIERYQDRLNWLLGDRFERRPPPTMMAAHPMLGHNRDLSDQQNFSAAQKAMLDARYGESPETFYTIHDDDAFVALSGERHWESTKRVLYSIHTRTHLAAMRLHPPLWFEDGMAAVMSNFNITRDECGIGGVDTQRLSFLLVLGQLMPWEEFFLMPRHDPLFDIAGVRWAYSAQSWLLLQYAYFSEQRSAQWRSGLLQLMVDIKQGRRDVEALLLERLGVDSETLTDELVRYVKRQRFELQFFARPHEWAGRRPKFQKMSSGEEEALLSEVKIRIQEQREEIARVTALADAGEATASDFGALAAYHHEQGEWRQALDLRAQAAQAGSREMANLRAAAEKAVRLRLETNDLSVWPEDAPLARWREDLRAALDSAEAADERTIEVVAWVEALAANPSAALVNRVQREVQAMMDPELTLLAIAQVRKQVGDAATTRALIEPHLVRQNGRWHGLARQISLGLESEE
jgi:hypothetical protein